MRVFAFSTLIRILPLLPGLAAALLFEPGQAWGQISGQSTAQSRPLAVPLSRPGASPLSAPSIGPSEGPGASTWIRTDHTELRLISATTTAGDRDTVAFGLHFKLKKGWKIYWRSPGDAGYPPEIDWKGSENLKDVAISWPAPERFSILGFDTLGYKDEVVLPMTAAVKRAGAALSLRAEINYLTCSDICVPYQANVALDLAGGGGQESAFAHLIRRFQAKVPGDGKAQGLSIGRPEVLKRIDKTILRVTANSALAFSGPELYVEGPPELEFGRPRMRLAGESRQALFEVPVFGIKEWGKPLAGTPLILTVVDNDRAAEHRATAVASAAQPVLLNGGPVEVTPLVIILALALVGGLILNLMPCVLPVLSIKLLGVVGHGGGERQIVRLSFLASAAGIVSAFIGLAGILIALKAGGAAVGWGIQFQQPWFLVAMTLIITLFACNLWGFFELRLPIWVSDLGEHSSHVHGLGGHFLSGAFAMLLATPCSAPFLGTAIGFALARGSGEILAVFATLGLGLALPYLFVAAAPGIATRLPRPGPWMVKLRKILGFALAVTGIWLLTVLDSQAGLLTASAVGLLMATAGLVLYLYHRFDASTAAAALALAMLAGTAFLTPGLLGNGADQRKVELEGIWKPFDRKAITDLVITGKTVFVDVTADWCITCQVNKALVLTKGRVFDRLKSPDVIAMKADWTRPSDVISRYLASFGRYGIPFNAVYGPGAPRGLALPELLTEAAVTAALDRATGGQRANETADRR